MRSGEDSELVDCQLRCLGYEDRYIDDQVGGEGSKQLPYLIGATAVVLSNISGIVILYRGYPARCKKLYMIVGRKKQH